MYFHLPKKDFYFYQRFLISHLLETFTRFTFTLVQVQQTLLYFAQRLLLLPYTRQMDIDIYFYFIFTRDFYFYQIDIYFYFIFYSTFPRYFSFTFIIDNFTFPRARTLQSPCPETFTFIRLLFYPNTKQILRRGSCTNAMMQHTRNTRTDKLLYVSYDNLYLLSQA